MYPHNSCHQSQKLTSQFIFVIKKIIRTLTCVLCGKHKGPIDVRHISQSSLLYKKKNTLTRKIQLLDRANWHMTFFSPFQSVIKDRFVKRVGFSSPKLDEHAANASVRDIFSRLFINFFLICLVQANKVENIRKTDKSKPKMLFTGLDG